MSESFVTGKDNQAYGVEDGACFGCGSDNPIGLRLVFEVIDDGIVRTVFTATRRYQGYAGLVHGGVVATLLDEALAWAIIKKYGMAVTGEFSMRHRQPVPTDVPLIITGRALGKRLGVIEAEGEVARQDGTILAQARGKFILVKAAAKVV